MEDEIPSPEPLEVLISASYVTFVELLDWSIGYSWSRSRVLLSSVFSRTATSNITGFAPDQLPAICDVGKGEQRK